MAFLGFLLLITGVIMNFQVLRKPYPTFRNSETGKMQRGTERLTPAELMRTPPWLISVGLVVAGLLLLVIR